MNNTNRSLESRHTMPRLSMPRLVMRRRRLIAATAVVSISAFAIPSIADPSDRSVPALLTILSDQQPATSADALAQGAEQLANRQYEEALASLQQARADDLNDEQKAQLQTSLAEAEHAAGERKAARAAFEQGEAAVASGDAIHAIWYYKVARENPFADAATVDKAQTQTSLALSKLGDAKALYDSAKADLDAGNLMDAKAKFTALDAVGFRGGVLTKSPADQLAVIAEKEAALSAPTAGGVGADVAAAGAAIAATADAPAAAPVDAKKEARAAYVRGRDFYAAGDILAAKAQFQRSADLGYRAGLGEVGPQKMLVRIGEKEAADAKAAALVMRQQEAAQAASDAVSTMSQPATPADQFAVDAQPAETPVNPPADAPTGEMPANVATDTPVEPPAANVNPVEPLNPVTTADVPATDSLQATADAARIKRESDRFQAAALVTRAKEAVAGNRTADAGRLYDEALRLDPNNAEAQAGKEQVLRLTGTLPRVADPLTRTEEILNARKDAIRFSVNTALEQAAQSQGANEFIEANRSLLRAQAARDSDPQIFTAEELRDFDSRIREARTSLTSAQEAARVADEAAKRQAAIAQQNAAQDAQEQQKRETIAALTRQARQLTTQGRYADALKIIDQIISIDPRNDYAIGVRQLVADRKSFQDQRRIQEKMNRSMVDVLSAADEARVPIPDLLTYPEDWPDLTAMRDATLARERGGATDAAIEATLAKQLPELRFDGVPFVDVVEFLRDTTQANIFVNWSAIEGAGIDKNQPITTRLKNVKFSKVLNIVLESAGGGIIRLGYTIDDGVITISTQEDLAKNVSIRNYDIRDLLVNVQDFDAPQFTPSSGGEGSSGNIFGNSTDNNQDDEDERETIVEQITQLITDTIASDTWKVNGGLIGAIQELSGQLIVTQTPENQTAISQLLEKLRETRAIQVNVEARFLTVQRNFLEEVGVDFDFQFNVDYGNFPNNGFNPNSDFSPVLVQQNSVGTTGEQPTGFTNPGNLITGLNTNLGGEAQANNYGLSTTVNAYLDDFRASLMLRAVQLGQNATTLTAPRLTLFNGQRAYLRVSTVQNYVSDLNPVVGTGTVGYDPQIDQLQSGVVLSVQATVSADRRYVTLTVIPQLQRIIALRQFAYSSGQATTVTDGGPAQLVTTFVQLPEYEITELATTVSVPDRGTLLLGGQTLMGEIERESGVPVLSKIPFLKRLFTNRGTSRDQQILLILIKPTIILQREIEQNSFPLLEGQ